MNVHCHALGGWGFFDESFHGNTYLSCHASNNQTGNYRRTALTVRARRRAHCTWVVMPRVTGRATFDTEGRVADFHHASRAKNTTVWLLHLDREEATLAPVLSELRSLGCDTVTLESQGCYAVSVPEATSLESIDSILARLDQDAVAVAFPSMRHEE